MAESIRVLGRAKVNLFLRVGPRRADGYHDLETLFHSVELADLVEISRVAGSGIGLACALDVPPERNLAVRAARLLCQKAGEERLGLFIRVEKKIPVEAGLGGGSADAAAVLVGLNALLGAPFDALALASMGRALGADVPFCVAGGMAEGRGTGDRLTPRPPLSFDLVVVKPPVAVATAWAYGALDAAGGESVPGDLDDVRARAEAGGAMALAGHAANDFERVVLSQQPQIGRARDALGAVGAVWAMMSGSGAAVFGVFPDRDAASRAAVELALRLPGHSIHVTRSAARGAEVLA